MISGVILAGGLGRRMGGVDKGLQDFSGKPLVQWVVERFAPQVDELLINANRNAERYAAFGHRVVADLALPPAAEPPDSAPPSRDAPPAFAGPLAGLQTALTHARHPLVACVPCDSPFLPDDLVSRLYAALAASGADLAFARTFDQAHPVFCLCRQRVLPQLTAYLASGGRKFESWCASVQAVAVAFDDEADAFSNINTMQDMARHAAPGDDRSAPR